MPRYIRALRRTAQKTSLSTANDPQPAAAAKHKGCRRRKNSVVTGTQDKTGGIFRPLKLCPAENSFGGDPIIPHKIPCANYCGGPDLYPTKFTAGIVAGTPIYTPQNSLRELLLGPRFIPHKIPCGIIAGTPIAIPKEFGGGRARREQVANAFAHAMENPAENGGILLADSLRPQLNTKNLYYQKSNISLYKLNFLLS